MEFFVILFQSKSVEVSIKWKYQWVVYAANFYLFKHIHFIKVNRLVYLRLFAFLWPAWVVDYICWIYLHTFKMQLKCFYCKEITKLEEEIYINQMSVKFYRKERAMNCPFSAIMVPVLCPCQVQYYDNWRLAVPSQNTLLYLQVMEKYLVMYWFKE